MNGSDPKRIARDLLVDAHPALIGLSHWIHANPELGYQEVLASGWITEWLTTAGFEVRTAVAGMPTAVVGSYGPGPFHVAVCVEYDALPAVGHACGHNVIAAAGLGAGLALAAVADVLGLRVSVLGTPAEETGGGKIGLIKAGELDGVHAAMMVHPWPDDQAAPPVIAIRSMNVAYTGTAAHAAGYPHLGVNAADALVVAQTAIALLRQQLRPTDRVHGIVTKGGDAPNIIPARTEAQWMVRGTSVARLDEVTALVRRCFEAGALATGATLEIQEEICYADVRHDPDLARLYQANAEGLGRVFSAPGMPLSTDMGNISYVVPTIHPMIGVEANGAVNHQAEFAAACATPSADRAILDGALALAWTAIDAAQDPLVRERLMAFRPDPAEVAMVSSAWMMPPMTAAPAETTAARPPETEAVGAAVEADADADVPSGSVEDDDPDSAWAADVDAVAQQMVAVGLLQDPAAGVGSDEAPATAPDDAEVLFVGFAEGAVERMAEPPPAPIRIAGAEQLQDPEAWEGAFEEAIGRGSALGEMDPTDWTGVAEEVVVASAWPPQERELVSRERIEAEGFAFVAPEISSSFDELEDAASRNGNGNGADHAGEDGRLR